MTSAHAAARPASAVDEVDRHKLGVGGVLFSQLSQIAPATVVFGVIPAFVGASGMLGVPIAVIAVGVVLALFAVGYLAMARHIPNPGAFYAYVGRGLWRPLGIGAAWLAIIAYVSFSNSAAGGFGVTTAALIERWTGAALPWWFYSAAAAVLVGVLGVRRIDLSAKILAVLAAAETLVVLINTFVVMLTLGFRFSTAAISVRALGGPGVGVLIVVAVLAFVGFEAAPVYTKESRDPRRTVPLATYLTLGVVSLVFFLAIWVQISGAGAQVVQRAGQDGTDLFGNLAAHSLGGWVVDLNELLFCTSVLAAMLAFHNVSARYIAVQGQDGILPRVVGFTTDQAPRNASLTLSCVTAVVILAYAVTGADPLVKLFFWGSTIGGLGILLLVAATSIAVIGFFAQDGHGEDVWHRLVAPLLAGCALMYTSYMALTHLPDLFGPGSDAISRSTLMVFFGVVAVGVAWGVFLRRFRPEVYEGIGLGVGDAGELRRRYVEPLVDQHWNQQRGVFLVSAGEHEDRRRRTPRPGS